MIVSTLRRWNFARIDRPIDGGNVLFDRPCGVIAYRAVLIGHDGKAFGGSVEQFTRRQQEIWITWPAVSFVALGKGFVQQNSARCDRRDDRRKDRPIEIIDDNDGGKLAVVKGPVRAIFKVGDDHFGRRDAGNIGNAIQTLVDKAYRMATVQEEPAMPSTTAGQV